MKKQRKTISGKILRGLFTAGLILLLGNCEFFSPGLGESVDIDPPVLQVDSHRNGDYVGGIVALYGKATDDIGVASLSIATTEGIELTTAALSGTNWTAAIDTGSFADGDHEFVLTVKDVTEKKTSTKLLLTVDNNPPTVMITRPEAYGPSREFNKIISIKGEAADTTRVKQVSLSIFNSATGIPLVENQPATGTSSWYFLLDSTDAPDGLYHLEVSAEDYSGNRSSYFYHFADILAAAVDPANLPNIEEINGADYQNEPLSSGVLTSPLTSLRKTAAPGNRVDATLNQDSDRPQFTFISPSLSLNPADNILASPQRFSGFAEDDDGMDYSSIRIAVWEDDPDDPVNPLVDPPVAEVNWVAPDISGNQWTYSVNLSDGDYLLKILGSDIYGVAVTPEDAPVTAFRVSSFAPVLTITAPSQGSYVGRGSPLEVVLNVSGAGSGSLVQLDPDGDDDWSNALTMPAAAGEGNYALTVTEGVNFAAVDGPQIFKFRAGTTGNFGNATLQLTGDITAPTIQATYPAAGDNTNGSFSLTGSASDENQISQVYLWIEQDSDGTTAPPADMTTWYTPATANVYNWVYHLDTENSTLNGAPFHLFPVQDGGHTLHFAAVDGAGNSSGVQTRSFIVNQASDIPVFSLSNVTEGTGSPNGLGKDDSIIGLAEDDDAIDVSTMIIKIDVGADGGGAFFSFDPASDFPPYDSGVITTNNTSQEWIPVNRIPDNDSRIASWSHNLQGLGQGPHRFQVRVRDINGVWGLIEPTDFIIDFGPPDVFIAGPANNSIQNSSFTISGTATDPNGVADVELFINSVSQGSVMTGTPGDQTTDWEYDFTVAANGSSDGDYAYQIQATDTAGGRTSVDRQVVVDASAPTVIIENPPAPSPDPARVNGAAVLVQGTANDNRSLRTVKYAVSPAADEPDYPDDYLDVNGLYSWNFSFNSLDLVSTTTPANYTLRIVAEDTAGNLSLTSQRTITIDQASDRPVISFNDIDKNETVAGNNVLVGATTLTGLVEDDDLIDPSLFAGEVIEINFDSDADGLGNLIWTPVSQPPSSTGKILVWRHDISTLDEGVHSVRVRVRDNQSDGTVGESSTSPFFESNFNWNIVDGPGQGGIPFILNLGPPSIDVQTPANYTYHNSDVLISGQAVDANGVASVRLSFNNGQDWTGDLKTNAGTTVDWQYNYTVAANGDDDGTAAYIIRATDVPGSSGVQNGQFTVDATAPESLVNQPTPPASQAGALDVVNGLLRITGTASDNISLSRVYYHIGLTAADAPVFDLETGGDYTLLAGRYSWSDIYATPNVTVDTPHTLRVIPVDNAGNTGEVNAVEFLVNQTTDLPVISLSSLVEGGSFKQNLLPLAKQISGTVTDDDAVMAGTIEYRIYDALGTTLLFDWDPVNSAPTSNKTLAPWSHTFGAPLTDGQYQLQIRAADIHDGGTFTSVYGYAETPKIRFAVDTANPQTSITPPNGSFINDDFTISGVATDDGGIQKVEITFDTPTPLTVTVYEDTDLTEAETSWSWNWTTGTGADNFHVDREAHSTDGVLNYTVTVTDAYDKQQTYDRYINLDTRPPVVSGFVLVNNDPGSPAEVNGSVLIQGSPSDNETFVKTVYIRTEEDSVEVNPPGLVPEDEGWTKLASTISINHRFNSFDLTNNAAHTTFVLMEDAAGNRSDINDHKIGFTVRDANNSPRITLNTADGALLAGTDTISGTITDDDGINVTTIQISIDGGTYENVTTKSPTNSTSVTFSNTLGSMPTRIAPYSIRIQAADVGESFADTDQNVSPETAESGEIFVYRDDAAPTVSITNLNNGKTDSPTLTGTYVNNRFTITGTATDDVQVGAVRAKLAGEENFTDHPVEDTDEDNDADTPFDTWRWHREGLNLSGDSVGLIVEVEDVNGKTTSYTYTLLVDKSLPGAGFITDPGTYHGSLLVSGTATDNILVSRVYLAHGTAVPGDPVSDDPADDGYTLLGGTNTYTWNYHLDTTGIHNLGTDLSYYVAVVAVDGGGNLSPKTVLALTINQASDRPSLSFLNVDEENSAGENLLENNAKVLGTAGDDDGIALIQFAVAEAEGALPSDYSSPAAWTTISADGTGETAFNNLKFMTWANFVGDLDEGVHYIRFRIQDTEYSGAADIFNENYSEVIPFTIDYSNPTLIFKAVEVDNAYSGGTVLKESGFTGMHLNNSFDLRVEADDANHIREVNFYTNSDTVITEGPFDLGSKIWESRFLIDRDGSDDGTMTITVEAIDSVGKITTRTLELVVDTVEPAVLWDPFGELEYQAGIPTYYGNSAEGGSLKLTGQATDADSSINRVDIFFEDGTHFLSPRTGASEAVGANQEPTDAAYLISIDNRLEKGITDSSASGNGDDDGFLEYFVYSSGILEWYTFLNNTYLFPEGPLTIHTWAYDEAGNRNDGMNDQVAAQISNYPPSIDSFDINSVNYNQALIKTKADNSVALTMNVSDSGGSGGIDTAAFKITVTGQYELIGGGQIGGKLTDLNIVYDQSHFTGVTASRADLALDTSGLADGFWYRIEGEIRDADSNVATRAWWLWEYDGNADTQAPVVTIDDFSQANVTSGGHIESAGESPDADDEADLSGTVKVTGTVWDDNPGPTVSVQYKIGAGVWTDVSPGTVTLTSVDDGDDVNGVDYLWSVIWDTATIAPVAAEDVLIRAVAVGGPSAVSPEKTVDIVPYITDITTGLEVGLQASLKRSALGRYTVASGAEITIHGYNLSAGLTIGASSPASTGDTSYRTLTLGNSNFGEVSVTTNEVTSRNNTNTNGLIQNREPAPYYPDRNDDRYLGLWELRNTGYTGNDATMRPRIDGITKNQDGMDWMYTQTSDTLYLSGSKMTTSFTLSGGDFGYNSEGTRLWSFLHNAKWWVTEANMTNEQYFGSVQWSMQNGYTYTPERDEAFNWNIAAQTARLGLGNMVYQAGTPGQIDRYESLQMKLTGDDGITANLVTYFDKNILEKGLTLVSFNTGTDVADTNYNLGGGWYSTIERVNPYDTAYDARGNEGKLATGIRNPEYAGTATLARHNIIPGDDASSVYMLAVDAAGAAYIAWYDPHTGGTDGFNGAGIKFMYNTSPVATPLAWSDPVTVVSNPGNTPYSHIALEVDPDGGIHLAYHDNYSGYLYYVFGASREAMGSSMNNVLVDALYSSGQYNSLVIKDFDTEAGTDYRPVITTFSRAFTESLYSLRIVYPVTSPATVGNGAVLATGNFTGAWESIAVPAATAPRTARTFTETSGTSRGQGNPLVGYNGTWMEEARYLSLP